LLPGALRQNRGLKFLCSTVDVRVESTASLLTRAVDRGRVLRLPINHFSGAFTCSPEVAAQLRAEGRVVLRYEQNPNGSTDDIAGICSPGGNVVGLMPHPERACDPFGSSDGQTLLTSMFSQVATFAGNAAG
jgi:phosphoribosylformylglycinamidine synthase